MNKIFIIGSGIITIILFLMLPLKAANLEKMLLEYDKKYSTIEHITVKEYQSNKATFVLIDCRSDEEQKVSMIANAIPHKILEADFDKFKKKNLIIYCTIGERSSRYTLKLISKGFANVANLRGGVLSWAKDEHFFLDSKGKKTYSVHVFGRPWNILSDKYKGLW